MALLLIGCTSFHKDEKSSIKANTYSNAKSITCPDGSLVDNQKQCIIHDPIIPHCRNSQGSFFYELNSGKKSDIVFKNLNANIELTLDQADRKWQGMWECKPTLIQIIGHADPVFGTEANTISENSAEIVYKSFIAHGISKDMISVKNLGGAEPFMVAKSPHVADKLNNRVDIQVEFEVK